MTKSERMTKHEINEIGWERWLFMGLLPPDAAENQIVIRASFVIRHSDFVIL